MADSESTAVKPPHELTWQDVQREALHCPVLQRLSHLDAMDSELTREQVMIWTLLWFSRNRREMLATEAERLSREPARVDCLLYGCVYRDAEIGSPCRICGAPRLRANLGPLVGRSPLQSLRDI